MSSPDLIVFAAAYFAVLILPGPGVTALLAQVLARGPRGVPAYIAGCAVGALVWFTLAAAGLAVLAKTFAAVFIVIRLAGAAYLLYLAWKLWTAPSRPLDLPTDSESGRWRMFLTGAGINLGNPKAMVFFLAVLPTVVDLGAVTPFGFVELAAVVVITVFTVLSAYAIAAARARRLVASPQARRWLGRGSGTVMAATAAALVTR